MIRIPHGYFRGGVIPLPDVCPTIDAHIACWHVLIGEFEMQEVKCNQVATLCGGKWEKTYEESRRVYGVDGIAPTVHTQGGEIKKQKSWLNRLPMTSKTDI